MPVTMFAVRSYGDLVDVAKSPKNDCLSVPKAMARRASCELGAQLRRAFRDGDKSLLRDLWARTVPFGMAD